MPEADTSRRSGAGSASGGAGNESHDRNTIQRNGKEEQPMNGGTGKAEEVMPTISENGRTAESLHESTEREQEVEGTGRFGNDEINDGATADTLTIGDDDYAVSMTSAIAESSKMAKRIQKTDVKSIGDIQMPGSALLNGSTVASTVTEARKTDVNSMSSLQQKPASAVKSTEIGNSFERLPQDFDPRDAKSRDCMNGVSGGKRDDHWSCASACIVGVGAAPSKARVGVSNLADGGTGLDGGTCLSSLFAEDVPFRTDLAYCPLLAGSSEKIAGVDTLAARKQKDDVEIKLSKSLTFCWNGSSSSIVVSKTKETNVPQASVEAGTFAGCNFNSCIAVSIMEAMGDELFWSACDVGVVRQERKDLMAQALDETLRVLGQAPLLDCDQMTPVELDILCELLKENPRRIIAINPIFYYDNGNHNTFVMTDLFLAAFSGCFTGRNWQKCIAMAVMECVPPICWGSDKAFAFAVVHINCHLVGCLPQGIRLDRDIALAAVRSNIRAPLYVDQDLWKDRDFVIGVLKMSLENSDYKGPTGALNRYFTDDEEIMLLKVRSQGSIGKVKVSDRLRDDPNWMASALQYVTEPKHQRFAMIRTLSSSLQKRVCSAMGGLLWLQKCLEKGHDRLPAPLDLVDMTVVDEIADTFERRLMERYWLVKSAFEDASYAFELTWSYVGTEDVPAMMVYSVDLRHCGPLFVALHKNGIHWKDVPVRRFFNWRRTHDTLRQYFV